LPLPALVNCSRLLVSPVAEAATQRGSETKAHLDARLVERLGERLGPAEEGADVGRPVLLGERGKDAVPVGAAVLRAMFEIEIQ